MKVSIKKLKLKPDEGGGAAFYAEYPVFMPDEAPDETPEPEQTGKKKPKKRKERPQQHEKLNRAVEEFVGSAAKTGKAGEFVTLTYQIYRCDNDFISFALDLLRRSGNALAYIRRFCFNWDCKAGVLLPLSAVTGAHRRLKKENGGSGDYTISSDLLYIHKNTFTPEAGQNCRRSRYKKFLVASVYNLNELKEPSKSAGSSSN